MHDFDPNQSKIIAIILAGGQGSRFNGIDKGLIQYRGKALVKWVIDAIDPQVDSIVLSVNRNLKDYQLFDLAIIKDKTDTARKTIVFDGPMAGIAAAIQALQPIEHSAILISSCDSPHLPDDYVQTLSNELHHHNADVAVVHDGNRQQNLHCLIRTTVVTSIVEDFEQGERAMHRWFNSVNTVSVDFSDQAACFTNINDTVQLS